MYQALYRKYRPKSFEEVVGQEVIIKTLSNAIKNDMVSHAYLFTGPRGTGKTSIAKIFAKILNCDSLKGISPCEKCASCVQMNENQNIDVIEIDAASNNGVDEIREIRNKIGLVPSNSKYKIYIVDEVHMLTNQAFNALLKTLEEPPKHIIFIFATTEPHKIPQTILSRCQRFDFKKISNKQNAERLGNIATAEKIKILEEAIMEIARLSDGGLRDSISLLDQAVSYADSEITVQDVHDINGSINKDEVRTLIHNLIDKNLNDILKQIEEYEEQGKSIEKIVQEVIEELKNEILYCNASEYFGKEDEFYKNIEKKVNNTQIYRYVHQLSGLISEMKNTSNSKILFEIEIIKLMELSEEDHDKPKEKKSKEVEKKDPIKLQEEVKTEEKKSIVKEEKKKDEENPKLAELKKVRINNSLVTVSQKTRKQFVEKLEELKILLMYPEHSKHVSLLFDGELKSISDRNIVFVYKTSLLADAFNMELVPLQKIFKEQFGEEYKLIALSVDEWDEIKDDYNKNKSSYKYQEENIDLKDIFKDKLVEGKEANEIDHLFDGIIEYV